MHNDYTARKTQKEIRIARMESGNSFKLKLLTLAEGLILNYKEGKTPSKIALSQFQLTNKLQVSS